MPTICGSGGRSSAGSLAFHGGSALRHFCLYSLWDHPALYSSRHGALWSLLLGSFCCRCHRRELVDVLHPPLRHSRWSQAVTRHTGRREPPDWRPRSPAFSWHPCYCLREGRTASCAATAPFTGTGGTGGTSGAAAPWVMPSFWRSCASIRPKTSRLSLRKLRTFSRP